VLSPDDARQGFEQLLDQHFFFSQIWTPHFDKKALVVAAWRAIIIRHEPALSAPPAAISGLLSEARIRQFPTSSFLTGGRWQTKTILNRVREIQTRDGEWLAYSRNLVRPGSGCSPHGRSSGWSTSRYSAFARVAIQSYNCKLHWAGRRITPARKRCWRWMGKPIGM